MSIRRRLLSGGASLLLALGLGIACLTLVSPQSPTEAAASGPAAGAGASTPWVAPEVLRQLEASGDSPLHIIVLLNVSGVAPLTALTADVSADRATARAQFVQAQQDTFSRVLDPLRTVLDEAATHGSLLARRELWLVNSLALTADPVLVRELMESPAIAEIRLDRYLPYAVEPEVWLHGGDVAPEPTAVESDAGAASASSLLPWGVERIGASQVRTNLGITGTGAVVAIIDTGVDWMHPDLLTAYRGTLGKGLYDHAASWYDAVNGGVYPYDDYGHGTHVAGIAVGASTGVAPGARWIGVKVLNNEGYGYDSWILSGLQWLLAPGGDPALAPDVVNASWGNTNGYATICLQAIEALEAAGIFPVFAAGNAGPTAGSVTSPASNAGVFAVGASDPDDEVAPFSGRGPSPWDETKPAVVAPGVNIVSAVPGGVYGEKSGTSMATPHVAGLGALMRAVSPTVSVQAMAALITGTAQPLTPTVPNNDSGWGRIDAYAALIALAQPSIVTGTVQNDAGEPVPGAGVTMQLAAPGTGGPVPNTLTDAEGRYFLALSPGQYTMAVQAYGYYSQALPRVTILPDSETELSFTLTRLPVGTVRGQLTVAATGEPVTTTVVVQALGTPISAIQDAAGDYALILPVGTYTLQVRGLGYRIVTGTVAVNAGQVTASNFALPWAPDLLLVDEGAWTYDSRVPYWRAALDDLRYAYDEITIKTPGPDTPLSSTLQGYDLVLWSAPSGSPGLVGAGPALTDYLDAGGRLLVSGQDVGFYDGGGLNAWGYLQPYLLDRMSTEYVTEKDTAQSVVGRGPFDGLILNLYGEDGADNQTSPDVVRVRDTQRASAVWQYDDGSTAGVAADVCVPHRSLLFGFGYEAIPGALQRREVMQRSIDWLMTEPLTAGLTLARVTDSVLVAPPGEQITHMLRVRHIGSAGVTETVRIALQGNVWPSSVAAPQIELPPCASALITVTVSVPAGVGVNESDHVTLKVTSTRVSTPVTTTVTSKTPAPVLLVDDDRWYPVEDQYLEALSAARIPFDLWDTRSGLGGISTVYSPLTGTLTMYPIVIWFTGYDWYAPITPTEEQRLMAYLDQGGHLLLSSQDFVYNHEGESLTDRLGIQIADWADVATEAAGVSEHSAGGTWGPVTLSFPFPNWSHTVEPSPGAAPVMRGQLGQPLGIAAGSVTSGAPRTLFYAVPLEALPLAARTQALANGVGWLSPLGGSDWRVTPQTASADDVITFTLVLRNSALTPLASQMTHRVPDDFEVAVEHLPSSLHYDADLGQLTWSGEITPNTPVTLTWTATWKGGAAPATQPTVTLTLPAWDLSLTREAFFYGDGPDLTVSHWYQPEEPRVGVPVSLTFLLDNRGEGNVAAGELSLWLMRGAAPITAMMPITHGVSVAAWSGALEPHAQHLLTIPIQGWTWNSPVRLDALIDDGHGNRWERSLWVTFTPWRSYLPTVMRNARRDAATPFGG